MRRTCRLQTVSTGGWGLVFMRLVDWAFVFGDRVVDHGRLELPPQILGEELTESPGVGIAVAQVSGVLSFTGLRLPRMPELFPQSSAGRWCPLAHKVIMTDSQAPRRRPGPLRTLAYARHRGVESNHPGSDQWTAGESRGCASRGGDGGECCLARQRDRT